MVDQRNGLTLQQLRQAANLTQRQVAIALDVTEKAVRAWEKGRTEPHLPPLKMQKMMELYGCDTIQELVDAVAASKEDST